MGRGSRSVRDGGGGAVGKVKVTDSGRACGESGGGEGSQVEVILEACAAGSATAAYRQGWDKRVMAPTVQGGSATADENTGGEGMEWTTGRREDTLWPKMEGAAEGTKEARQKATKARAQERERERGLERERKKWKDFNCTRTKCGKGHPLAMVEAMNMRSDAKTIRYKRPMVNFG
eukprot:4313723-Pleurochrysis_carterae.AAC.1